MFSCILSSNADARHNRPPLERLQQVSTSAARMVGIRDSLRFEFKNIEMNMVPHLELVRSIEEAIVRFEPEWIFSHHPGDLNIDHRVCHEATMAAALLPQRLSRGLPPTMIRRIFLCEIPSSTDWAFPADGGFHANSFFDVSTVFATKLEALKHFEGALKPPPHSRSVQNVEALARMRGAQVNVEFAEAFCLVRDLHI